MKFKGIFFDLYGTLLIYTNNSKAWSDWITTFYRSLKNYGLKLSKESFALKCDGFFGKEVPYGQNDGLTLYERRIQRLCRELNLELSNEELQSTAESCLNAWHKYIVLDPISIPLLKELKKKRKIALISNFDYAPHIYSILHNMNLIEYFDSIVISDEVGVKKPDPHIFTFAFEQTRLGPKEVVYVGDAPEDIQAAKAAGIYPILIQRNIKSSDSLITDYWANQDSISNNQFHLIFKNVKIISNLQELFELIE